MTETIGALEYASRGLPVFPVYPPGKGATGCFCSNKDCQSPAKHPWSKFAPHGSKDATTDVEQVTEWWRRAPNANVGVATGGVAHLVVLDVDPDKGGAESLRDLELEHGRLPLTPTVLTGGGGEHYYFRAPEGEVITNSASNLGPGLDVRGRGGYVVAPPSVHRSGGVYEWQAGAGLDEVEIAPLPDWLLALVRESVQRTRTDTVAQPGADLIEGQRNNALASLAGTMRRRGFTHAAIEAALLAENAERCNPPLADDEVRKIAASVARYAPEGAPSGGYAAPPAYDPTLAPAWAPGGDEEGAQGDAPPAVRQVAAVDGASFILDAPLEVAAIWGNGNEVLWARGETLMILAPQGLGKTTVAQQIALCRIGRRSQFLGYPIEPSEGKVLYLASDRPSQARRSFARMVTEEDREALRERLLVWPGPLPFDLAKEPTALAQFAASLGARTIIVDSLKDVALDLAKDETGSRVNAAFQTCLAAGIELLVLNHPRKALQNAKGEPTVVSLDDSYGSTWITAGMGSVIALAGKAGDLVLDVHHLKAPLEQLHPFRVTHDPDRGTTTATERPDLRTFMEQHPEGITAKQAAQVLSETDSPSRNDVEKARRKLRSLVERGHVVEIEGRSGGSGGGTETRWRNRNNNVKSVHESVHAGGRTRSVHGAFTDEHDSVNADSESVHGAFTDDTPPSVHAHHPLSIERGVSDAPVVNDQDSNSEMTPGQRVLALEAAVKDLAEEAGWPALAYRPGHEVAEGEEAWLKWLPKAPAGQLTQVYDLLTGRAD
ncbi:MAG: bifunctional DNA primase/polymerase [Dehalococcoidia bacterium]|nr:bifunctional DNA primase/polymerase [Dehalococcoidia bacterium]